jgi:hypothetical protein
MPVYDDNPAMTGRYVTITADCTTGRRSRAAQINNYRRRFEREHGVRLALLTRSYSETYGFLSRSAFRYTMTAMMTDRGMAPVYSAGSVACLDSFAGMLRATVTRVIERGIGYQATPASGQIEVRMNVTRGGYTKGEVIICGAHDIVPLGHRLGSNRIASLYVWA